MTLGYRKTFKGNESDILKYLIKLRLINSVFSYILGGMEEGFMEFFYLKVEKNAIKSCLL